MKDIIRQSLKQIGLLEAARSMTARYRELKLLPKNLVYKSRTRHTLPFPPSSLITAVTGTPDVQWFDQSGRLAVKSIMDILSSNRIEIQQFDKLLDFGCGCGRVIRHWPGILQSRIRIQGTDTNEKLIAWCKKNLSFAEFITNSIHPPLPYNDGEFDLIYGFSVFTHLSELLQSSWINELRRILKPEGYILLSLHGRFYVNQLTARERDQFLQDQLVIRREGPVGSNRFAAYHPYPYVQKTFGQIFKFVQFTEQGAKGNPSQDIYLFRKSHNQRISLN